MFRMIFFSCVLFFVGCTNSSHLDARLKAKKRIENLTGYLAQIKSKEDLKDQSKKIKKEVEKLAKIMILIRKEQLKSKELKALPVLNQYQDRFEREFSRVMAIDGCKEIYQAISMDALYLLDAFERKIQFPTNTQFKTKKIEES